MDKIGLVGATAIGLGAIIGAGIFVLSGVTINLAGNGAILAFLLTGIVAIMVAFEVGELSSRMPNERGASYSFAYNAFGSELGFTTGMLRLLSFVASIAAIATGFGSYLGSILGIASLPYQLAFSVVIILALAAITRKGVRIAAGADTALVSFKVIVLILFVIFGLYAGRATGLTIPSLLGTGWSGIFAAGVISMFAYAGFQSIASITPYIEGGGRTASKAIILSVLISAVLYVGVTFAMLRMAPASAYQISADPLVTALTLSSAPGWFTVLVGIAALVATASATLAMLVGCSMLLYQMSLDGLLPRFLKGTGKDDSKHTLAVIASALLGIAFLFAGNIYIIAAISNFGTIFSYAINNLAIIKIRALEKGRKYKNILASMHLNKTNIFLTPAYPYIPIAVFMLLALFFFGLPVEALGGGVVVILLSILVYYTFREVKEKPIIKVRIFG